MKKLLGRVRDYQRGFPERQAARDRLPAWAKLIQLVFWVFVLCAIALGWVIGFLRLYFALQGTEAGDKSASGFLLTLPGVFAAIPLSMILTNLFLWLVPPLRRANNVAAAGVKGMSFREATKGLLIAALIMVPICLALSLVGLFLH